MRTKSLGLSIAFMAIFTLALAASAQAGKVKSKVNKAYKLTKCGTVIHIKSGLEWAPDPGYSMNWGKAKKYARDLKRCGHKDWKLPRKSQIYRIYDEGFDSPCRGKSCHKGESFHIHKKLKLGDCCPWTLKKDEDGRITCLNFSTGNEGGMPKSSPQRVLAVRRHKKK